MSKPIKIALGVLAALVALLAAGVAYLAATFDPNDYKPMLVERVQRDYGRTLAIPGKIGLSVFPDLGISLGEVSISEAGSAERFASLKSARVSLAVMPLLRRRVVVDQVAVSARRPRSTPASWSSASAALRRAPACSRATCCWPSTASRCAASSRCRA